MVERCWSANSGEERAFALLTLDELRRYLPDWPHSILEGRIDQLGSWISEPLDPMGYGVFCLLNNIHQNDKKLAAEIITRADPLGVAAAVSGVKWPTAYNLAHLLQAVFLAGPTEWKRSFKSALDRKACLEFAGSWPVDQHFYAFSEFCKTSWEENELALDLVETFLPRSQDRLVNDPIAAFHELDDVAWHVLRLLDPLGVYVGRFAPTARMKSLGRQLCAPLRPQVLAEKLSSAQKRDFQTVSFFLSFPHKASPPKFTLTVRALDWRKIEDTIGDDWSDLFHDAEVLVAVCYGDEGSRSVVESLIDRNLHRIVLLPPRLAIMAPDAAFRHVASNAKIALARHGHFHWQLAAGVLAHFADKRPDLVERLLAPHEEAAGAVLSQKHPSWYKEAALFIRLMRHVAPDSLERMFSAVNVKAAEEGWTMALKGKEDGRRAVAMLIESAIGRTDELGEMARRMRKRFSHRSQMSAKDLVPFDEEPGSATKET